MSVMSKSSAFLLPLAMIAVPLTGLSAQQDATWNESSITVNGERLPDLSTMTAGPEVEGIISAHNREQIKVTMADGTRQTLAISGDTKVKASGGFLGLNRTKLGADSLINGLPVTIQTLKWDGGLFANQVAVKNKDLKFASMIQTGTEQGFAEQTAATDALRSRVADIDNYNVKSTTNVNFDTGKADLSLQAKNDLCAAATTAQNTDNALLLVIGYTDSTGTEEINQALSEKRATKVVNYLQQSCGWKPYRMLTPTGMATADPLADNSTPEGKAMNRRVAVNILVSKAVDGL